MKKIINPYLKMDNYQCFACSPYNKQGLQLEFQEDGESIISIWNPDPAFEGYPGVLHGGIQAVLMDEIAAWTVYVKGGTGGVTQSMNSRYLKPLFLKKGPFTIRGKINKQEKRNIEVHAQITDSDKKLCAEAEVNYFVLPPELASKKYHYPGKEAFFST